MVSKRFTVTAIVVLVGAVITTLSVPLDAARPADGPISLGEYRANAPTPAWRTDPVWHDGRAEWALYDAVRPIYGRPRAYEATIFTNTQRMDRRTAVKTDGPGIEVFKHNVSEIIPTERYDYRFLTTTFSHADDMKPYKLTFTSQEDCGSTFKEIVFADGTMRSVEHCYFPGAGRRSKTLDVRPSLALQDALSLSLRDFPFENPQPIQIKLVPDQTDTHSTRVEFGEAIATYAGRETIQVPFGAIDAHRIRVEHPRDGGATSSEYWFAADPKMQNVMVRYQGPYGVTYDLKSFGRWAYWDSSDVRPDKR